MSRLVSLNYYKIISRKFSVYSLKRNSMNSIYETIAGRDVVKITTKYIDVREEN